jgi:hypothetical protein
VNNIVITGSSRGIRGERMLFCLEDVRLWSADAPSGELLGSSSHSLLNMAQTGYRGIVGLAYCSQVAIKGLLEQGHGQIWKVTDRTGRFCKAWRDMETVNLVFGT